MKRCINCNTVLNDSALFCSMCGCQEFAEIQEVPAETEDAKHEHAEPEHAAPQQITPEQDDKPLSPKDKIGMTIMVGVIIFGFIYVFSLWFGIDILH